MKRFILAALLAVSATLGFSSDSQAGFRLRIQDVDTGLGVVITDNDIVAGKGDTNSDLDAIEFSGKIGTSYTLSVTVGTKTPYYENNAAWAGMDLTNVSILKTGTSTAPGHLQIILESDGFTDGPDGVMQLVNQSGGTLGPAGSTITFTSFVNPTNAMPDLDGVAGDVDTLIPAALAGVTGLTMPPASTAPAVYAQQTFSAGAFGNTVTSSFVKNGAYSLYSVVDVSFAGNGSVSFNNETFTSPAPAGLLLALTAAPFGLGAWLRRRRAVVAVA